MRTVSIRSLLGRLVWFSILPLLALGVYLEIRHVDLLRQDAELSAEHRLKNAATLIDNFVLSQIAGLNAMSHSPLLDEPARLAEFYRVAQGFRDSFGIHVILAEASGQMLLNTRVPFGQPLPMLPPASGSGQAAAPTALQTERPAVGDIVQGPVARQKLLAIAVPVRRQGSPMRLLLSTMEAGQIAAQLQKVSLPEGWTLSLLDGKGEVIARHPQAASKPEDDADTLRATIASTGNRWQVTLDIDHTAGHGPLQHTIAALIIVLLLAAYISYLTGRRASMSIERALSSLAGNTAATTESARPIREIEDIRRRLAESAEAMRASEARYHALFNNHHTPMLLIEPDGGRIVDANPAAVDFYGRTRDELMAIHIYDINTLSEDEVRAEMSRAAKEHRNVFRFRHRKAGGEVADVNVYSGPVEIDGRKLLFSIIHDETRRVRAEQALHASEVRYEELFVANPQPMWFYDLDTLRFLAVNDAAINHYGYSREEFLAMTIADIRPKQDIPRLNENLERIRHAANPGPDHAGHWRHIRKDGSVISVDITSHMLDYNGHRAEVVLATDITERMRVEERVAEYVGRLENSMTGTAAAIAQIMDLRDPYTAGHERRVGIIAAAIAREMGLSDSMQRGLHIAGDLHDLGKITVPVEILSKPGRLSPSEFALIKMHPQSGYDVLKSIDFPWPVAEVARQHHERIDGSGYPRGLKGEEILLEARILAVADTIEAMSSHRPYRPGLGIDKALAEVEAKAGLHYDSKVVAACLRLFREKGFRIPD